MSDRVELCDRLTEELGRLASLEREIHDVGNRLQALVEELAK